MEDINKNDWLFRCLEFVEKEAVHCYDDKSSSFLLRLNIFYCYVYQQMTLFHIVCCYSLRFFTCSVIPIENSYSIAYQLSIFFFQKCTVQMALFRLFVWRSKVKHDMFESVLCVFVCLLFPHWPKTNENQNRRVFEPNALKHEENVYCCTKNRSQTKSTFPLSNPFIPHIHTTYEKIKTTKSCTVQFELRQVFVG